jgi:hypothetical protein
MLNRHHPRRPKAPECTVEVYSLFHVLNPYGIEASSDGCAPAVSTGHTL